MPDFDDLSPDEAEALAAHLAAIRAKKEAKAKREAELKAKLKQAQEEAARLTAELGELDVSLDDADPEEGAHGWSEIENLSAEEKRERARQQAADAGVSYDPLPGGFTEETLPRDDDPRGWDKLEAALNEKVRVAPGDAPLVEDTVMPKGHGRVARQSGEGEHAPGHLSATRRGRTAEDELGRDYHNNVRVIPYRFKHRAKNGRTLVNDEADHVARVEVGDRLSVVHGDHTIREAVPHRTTQVVHGGRGYELGPPLLAVEHPGQGPDHGALARSVGTPENVQAGLELDDIPVLQELDLVPPRGAGFAAVVGSQFPDHFSSSSSA